MSGVGPQIRLLALDCDGVLTDGSILILPDGTEAKRFHASDGVALRLWGALGLPAAVITGRSGSALRHRLADLGVSRLIEGSKDKLTDLARLEAESGVPAASMAYIGDDWPDLPVLRRVGLAMAVADAAPLVRDTVRAAGDRGVLLSRPGGHGAVREAVELLLRRAGLWERAVGMHDR